VGLAKFTAKLPEKVSCKKVGPIIQQDFQFSPFRLECCGINDKIIINSRLRDKSAVLD